MKKLIVLILFIPVLGFSQVKEIYLKLKSIPDTIKGDTIYWHTIYKDNSLAIDTLPSEPFLFEKVKIPEILHPYISDSVENQRQKKYYYSREFRRVVFRNLKITYQQKVRVLKPDIRPKTIYDELLLLSDLAKKHSLPRDTVYAIENLLLNK